MEAARGRVDTLKHSLIAAGGDYKTLFPEYAPPPEVTTEEEFDQAPADANWDYSDIEWKSPADDPGAFEALMAKLNSPQSFTGDEVGGEQQEITWTEWE